MTPTERFIKRAKKVHGDKYSYSYVNYTKTKKKVKIYCPQHGVFKQTPNDHLSGYGCPSCGYCRMARSHLLTTKDFVNKATKKFNDMYDYSLVDYKGTHKHVIIICPKHGQFEQTPRQHLRGKTGGCRKCAGLFKTTDEFVRECKRTHGNEYNYDKVVYINAKTFVVIVCPKHGQFHQRPYIHASGSGCPKCCLQHHSKKAIQWIQSIEQESNIKIQHFLDSDGEYKIPDTRYKVDGYCESTNTIYEFHGDVFHGNPRRFRRGDKCHPFNKHVTAGELYRRTQKKVDVLKKMGYNVVEIWEMDWDNICTQKVNSFQY